mmetsp:Transcript_32494/g.28774  ORF Transcript_32494/g.28774 Transcript_32494/m.28774 type:complete len:84 (+) Transcript_32494:803-1054(+)
MHKNERLTSKRNSHNILKSSASIKSNLDGSNRYSRIDRDNKRKLRETLDKAPHSSYENNNDQNQKMSRNPLSRSVHTIIPNVQ